MLLQRIFRVAAVAVAVIAAASTSAAMVVTAAVATSIEPTYKTTIGRGGYALADFLFRE